MAVIFLYTVLFDAYFVTSKDGKDVSSLEVLVECFSSARGDERFEIFEETIKEALLEAMPKADPEDSKEKKWTLMEEPLE